MERAGSMEAIDDAVDSAIAEAQRAVIEAAEADKLARAVEDAGEENAGEESASEGRASLPPSRLP